MPSTVTHEYYYRDVYKRTSAQFKIVYEESEYLKHSAFAQGHDALFFSKFWKIHKHEKKRNIVHNLGDNKFREFVIEVVNLMKARGLCENKEVKLWLYGYILHHILDSYAHPFIIYMSEKDNLHADVESFLDQEMIKRKEWADPHKFKVHDLIHNLPKIGDDVVSLIDDAFLNVYGYEGFGKMYIAALNNVHIFLRLFRYDPLGIKGWGYDIIDKMHISHTTFSWLSYKKSFVNYEEYLNEEKKVWINPVDSKVISTESFLELYEKALEMGAHVISDLESCFQSNKGVEEFLLVVPDRSAIHGQKCGRKLSLVNLREPKHTK